MTSTLNNKLLNFIYASIALILLTLYTSFSDPVNSPKFLILIFSSLWLLTYVLSSRKLRNDLSKNSRYFYLVAGFNITLLIASIFSKDKYNAIFGEFLRKSGFTTYISLGFISLLLSAVFTINEVSRFYNFTTFLSIPFTVYAIAQSFGADFINWANPYNQIIVTVGNPNFSSAIMAILGILNLCSLLDKNQSKIIRILNFVIYFSLIFAIVQSNSRQGLLLIIFGSILLLIFSNQLKLGKSEKIGLLVLFLIGIFVSIFGMLRIGPAADLLYKDSVSVRGYYWRAAWQMFLSNPLFGVGVDSYGDFFRAYREVGYPLKYGFNITSTAAHNVFLQLLSTAGIFVFIFYICIVIYVLGKTIKYLGLEKNQDIFPVYGIFIAWLAYIGQSIISIDMIAVSMWNWVLMGILVGIINNSGKSKEKIDGKIGFNSNKIIIHQRLVAVPFVVLFSIFGIQFAKAEHNVYLARSNLQPNNSQACAQFQKYADAVIASRLADPYDKLTVSTGLLDCRYFEDGIKEISFLAETNPQVSEYKIALAGYYEKNNNVQKALEIRESLSKLDPFNASNYLQMAFDYQFLGDKERVKKYKEKILSFAANTPEGERALKELSNP